VIVRFEPWGAWVRLDSMPAIVALDREGVRALGLDGGEAWVSGASASAPLEVHLAVTARCGAGCKGCYIDARPDGLEPSREDLERRLDALGEAGVFTVAFGGGEPTTRDDLDALAARARARGMTPVLTTSGLGLSEARVERLRAFAQVNVSYDGSGDTYSLVRGFDGAAHAEHAIERLARAGIAVGVNVVLTRASFATLRHTLARARELGAREAQLLRYKPAGRAASPDYLARRLTPDQARALAPTLRALSSELCAGGDFRLRIDCALVPFLSADEDFAGDPEDLVRFGVMGCEAAGTLAAITADGRVAPCSFAQATDLAGVDLARDHQTNPELSRWRAWMDAPTEPCASCALRAVCRGGCKVVAAFVDGALGPDPECPRVVQHRSRPSPTPAHAALRGEGGP
jgi:radical SAM protein with 4Fe4S-binding SPASM domain